jgi:WD40 repeat protein
MRLWDAATGAPTQVRYGHTDKVNAVAFSPDSKLVASASDDGTVRLWDAATGAPTQVLKGHTDKVNAVAFSPDNKLVASASDDGTVQLWDAATGDILCTFADCLTPILAFSEDGLYLRTKQGSLLINGDLRAAKTNHNGTLFIKDNWIATRKLKLLWLPLEYQPCCSVVQDSLVALGLSSGIVKVLQFNIRGDVLMS